MKLELHSNRFVVYCLHNNPNIQCESAAMLLFVLDLINTMLVRLYRTSVCYVQRYCIMCPVAAAHATATHFASTHAAVSNIGKWRNREVLF